MDSGADGMVRPTREWILDADGKRLGQLIRTERLSGSETVAFYVVRVSADHDERQHMEFVLPYSMVWRDASGALRAQVSASALKRTASLRGHAP